EYPCKHCSRVFKAKSGLISHCKSAHNENCSSTIKKNTFPCDICPYRALSRQSLEIHVCTHTGERPHKCTVDECSASFSSSGALKKHHREVHKLKPIYCPICEEKFDVRWELTRHKGEHHKIPSQKDPMKDSSLEEEKSLNEPLLMDENVDEST
ncbi:hypothetical protein PENTCL1PPCAC_12479, partial [Pristionchus entomophagus]